MAPGALCAVPPSKVRRAGGRAGVTPSIQKCRFYKRPPPASRMRLLLLSLLSALVLPAALAQTGRPVPELAGYDAFFPDFLDRHGLPGAAVAVAKDGRLVYARGFGEADADAGVLVEPTSRFRIASISKPVTAVVAMTLAEDGRLDLDARAFAFLDDLPAPDGQTEDARLADVTVRDLLLHTGGWDRDGTGYDPMFDNARIAAEMGVTGPASVETIIRYMRGRPLDFTPGARYAYSNFGYAVLGRVLERVAGEPYEQLVQGVLADAGIAGMEIGASRLSGRLPGEVRYYPTGQTAPSVFDGSRVPWPYGGFYLESMDAHGGWVASAPDLLRLTTALDGLPNRPDLLSAASMAEMTGRPGVSTWTGTPYWYGLGWSVNTSGHWWHLGSLPGSESLVVRSRYQGLHWAVLLNARTAQSGTYMAELDNAMWALAQGVGSWPTHDLFESTVAGNGAPAVPAPALSVAPNPVRGVTTVRPSLDAAAGVRVEAFDALGRRVRTLLDEVRPAGDHALRLDVGGLPPGVYRLRAATPGGRAERSVTVVR